MGVEVGRGVGVNVGVGVIVGVGLAVQVGVMVGVGMGGVTPEDNFSPKMTAAVKMTTAKPPRMKSCFRVRRFVGAATGSSSAGSSISKEAPHIRQVLAPSATRAPQVGQ